MFCIISIAIVIWSIFGVLPTKVQGQGIVLKKSGTYQVMGTADGRIQSFLASKGDHIQQGQVILRTHQPELLLQLTHQKQNMKDAQLAHEKLDSFHQKNLEQLEKNLNHRKENLNVRITNANKRLSFLNSYLENQIQMQKRGLITPREIESTQQQIDNLKNTINDSHLQINEIVGELFNAKSNAEKELLLSENQLAELRRNIHQSQSKLDMRSAVHSPYSGTVLEAPFKVGDLISLGQPVLTLEDTTDRIELVAFVSRNEGKKIKVGMAIDISPSNVKREEFGSIMGLVTSVSDFPSSASSIENILSNPELVAEVVSLGAPIQITADLLPDNNNTSGYKWTSSGGPDVVISSGTSTTCSIVTERRRPITLVIPYFKKWLGL